LNLKLQLVKKLFEPKSLDKLTKALARDKVIIKAVGVIVDSKLEQLNKPTKSSDFDKSSWPFNRAFLDGRKAAWYELKQILEESKPNGNGRDKG
jgi:hypothetical protein